MSQNRPPGRAGEEDEDYVPPPYPVQQPDSPPTPYPAQRPVAPRTPPPRRPASRAPQRPSDNFPLAVTAVVVLLVLGLGLVFLGVNGNAGANTGAPPAAGIPAAQSTVAGAILATSNPQAPAVEQPPRMKLADFKQLYDNPATRPLILDVRAKEAYDQGHIVGAISFPESDVDTRVGELPKGKLIVAYCQ